MYDTMKLHINMIALVQQSDRPVGLTAIQVAKIKLRP